jgi:hypothetical protein
MLFTLMLLWVQQNRAAAMPKVIQLLDKLLFDRNFGNQF